MRETKNLLVVGSNSTFSRVFANSRLISSFSYLT